MEYPSVVWSHIDPLGADLVKKLLVVDVDKRLTVEGALKHPWCVKGLNLLKEQGGALGEMAAEELRSQSKLVENNEYKIDFNKSDEHNKIGNDDEEDNIKDNKEDINDDYNDDDDDEAGGFIREGCVDEPPEKKMKN